MTTFFSFVFIAPTLSRLYNNFLILNVPLGVIRSPSFFYINSSFTNGTFYFIVLKYKIIFNKNMHRLNVIVVGPHSFVSTLNELKNYLKFNISGSNNNLSKIVFDDDKLLLCHQEFLDDKKNLDLIKEITCTKILVIENTKKRVTF